MCVHRVWRMYMHTYIPIHIYVVCRYNMNQNIYVYLHIQYSRQSWWWIYRALLWVHRPYISTNNRGYIWCWIFMVDSSDIWHVYLWWWILYGEYIELSWWWIYRALLWVYRPLISTNNHGFIYYWICMVDRYGLWMYMVYALWIYRAFLCVYRPYVSTNNHGCIWCWIYMVDSSDIWWYMTCIFIPTRLVFTSVVWNGSVCLCTLHYVCARIHTGIMHSISSIQACIRVRVYIQVYIQVLV